MTMTRFHASLLPLVLSATGVSSMMTEHEQKNAGCARWVLRAMNLGTLTNSANDPSAPMGKEFDIPDAAPVESDAASLFANAVPFGSDKDTGRLFFYFKGEHTLPGATLTVSQGGVNPDLFAVAGCGTSDDSVVDIQDPQCTKLSVSGDAFYCGLHHGKDREECITVGKEALFSVHPDMKDWPEDEYFVHELFPREEDGFWMINAYGGDAGKAMGGLKGFTTVPEGWIVPHAIGYGFTYEVPPFAKETPPEDVATHARWITHHAHFATVSTLDDAGEGYTFGNPRSVTDGASPDSSSGLHVFNVPDADATVGDMDASDMAVAVSFSGGQVFEGVAADGSTCGGMCAEVVIYGKAVPLSVNSTEFMAALADFKATHPMAKWLWEGGSHMTSKYYTVVPSRILFRSSPEEEAVSVDVTEYLDVVFGADNANEVRVHKLVENEQEAGLGEEEPDGSNASGSKTTAMSVIVSLVIGCAIAF